MALRRWKRDRIDALAAESELVSTDLGDVEVARRGSGYPVLVLHGTPGGYDQALQAGAAMFGDDHEIIAPSRPGYLRTPLTDAGSPSDQAALFVSLLDELHVQEALVVGISGGGPHALHVAAEHPERVSGVILGSAITTEIDERLFDTGNPLVDSVLTSTPVLDVRSGLFALLARLAPDRLLSAVHGMVSTLEGEAFERYVASVTEDPDQRRLSLDFVRSLLPASERIEGTLTDEAWFRKLPLVDYGAVACPVLVVHGEYDAAVPMSHAELAAEEIPDAKLVRLESDHLAWLGPDAARAGREVREFVDAVTSQSRSASE
jgi:pimeloyl-ACP methyl ester carboxylesterase